MKVIFSFILVLAILFGTYHIYESAANDCRLPVTYSIGQFDERFGITKEEALQALRSAEAVWEESLGRNDIFEYKENAPLRVNFVYDERQRQAEAAGAAKDDLNTRGEANQVLSELHRQLVADYKAQESHYDSRRFEYEQKLEAYNQEVERYNKQGGAPVEVYEKLEAERRSLDAERVEINRLGDQLNDLSDRINEIGEKGNELIGEYNRRVRQFNDTFVHDQEFTQGDYRGRQINIYTWNGFDELILVLTHEFGHALSIGHVDDPQAVMHYLMGEQPIPAVLKDADLDAFNRVCDLESAGGLLSPLRSLYNRVINK